MKIYILAVFLLITNININAVESIRDIFKDIGDKLDKVTSFEISAKIQRINNRTGNLMDTGEINIIFNEPNFINKKTVFSNGTMIKEIFDGEIYLVNLSFGKRRKIIKVNFKKLKANVFENKVYSNNRFDKFSTLMNARLRLPNISNFNGWEYKGQEEKSYIIRNFVNDRGMQFTTKYWVGINDGIIRRVEQKNARGNPVSLVTVDVKNVNKNLDKKIFMISSKDTEAVDITKDIIEEATRNPRVDVLQDRLAREVSAMSRITRFARLEQYKKEISFRRISTYYYIYVPENYDKKKQYKLVVFLHGFGVHPGVYFTEWLKYIKNKNYIFIALKSVGRTWGRLDSNIMQNLIANVMKKYRVKSSDMFYIGHSAGGAAAYMFAFNLSFTPRGVVVFSGQLVRGLRALLQNNTNDILNRKKSMEIYQLAGSKDRTFLRNARTDKKFFDSIGIKSTLIEIPGWGHPFNFSKIPDILSWIDELD